MEASGKEGKCEKGKPEKVPAGFIISRTVQQWAMGNGSTLVLLLHRIGKAFSFLISQELSISNL